MKVIAEKVPSPADASTVGRMSTGAALSPDGSKSDGAMPGVPWSGTITRARILASCAPRDATSAGVSPSVPSTSPSTRSSSWSSGVNPSLDTTASTAARASGVLQAGSTWACSAMARTASGVSKPGKSASSKPAVGLLLVDQPGHRVGGDRVVDRAGRAARRGPTTSAPMIVAATAVAMLRCAHADLLAPVLEGRRANRRAGRVTWLTARGPFTAAGQRRTCTGFPRPLRASPRGPTATSGLRRTSAGCVRYAAPAGRSTPPPASLDLRVRPCHRAGYGQPAVRSTP